MSYKVAVGICFGNGCMLKWMRKARNAPLSPETFYHPLRPLVVESCNYPSTAGKKCENKSVTKAYYSTNCQQMKKKQKQMKSKENKP